MKHLRSTVTIDEDDHVRGGYGLLYYAGLLLACAVGITLAYSYLFLQEKVPVWKSDGTSLYINAAIYEGKLIRSLIKGLLKGQLTPIPMFTYTIGYGADAIMSISCLFDPYCLLFGLCPTKYTEYMYVGLVYLRIVVSAYGFTYYARNRGSSASSAFVASLCFVFSGFSLYWGVLRHPWFLTYQSIFPFVMKGVDDLFETGRSRCFVISMALIFTASVYFGYIACVTLLIYCFIRYVLLRENKSLKDFFLLFISFVWRIALCVCLAGISAVPNIFTLLGQDRVGSERYVQTFYTLSSYLKIPIYMIGGLVGTYSWYMGAMVVALVIAFCVARRCVVDKRLWMVWLLGLVLVVVGGLIPAVGSAFNGSNYATDRWMVIFAFANANAILIVFDALPLFETRQWRYYFIASFVIMLFCLVFPTFDWYAHRDVDVFIWPLVALAFFLACVLGLYALRLEGARIRVTATSLLILLGVGLTSFYYCSPAGGNYADDFSGWGKAIKSVTSGSAAQVIDKVEDDGIYRYSFPTDYANRHNIGLSHGTMAIDFFSSFYNQYVYNFRESLGISDDGRYQVFTGHDGRLAVDLLTGAKYEVAADNDIWHVPYSYTATGVSANGYSAYKTENALPIIFATSKTISENAYEKLNTVERQEVLLQGVVLSAEDLPAGSEIDPKLSTQTREVKVISADDGVLIDGNTIMVTKSKSSIQLAFEGAEDCENYLCLENLHYQWMSPLEVQAAKSPDKEPSRRTIAKDLLSAEASNTRVFWKTEDRSEWVKPLTRLSHDYTGKSMWIMNMGYSKDPITKVTITLEKNGIYTFDSLNVKVQPVKQVIEYAKAMPTAEVSDIKLETNKASATVTQTGESPQVVVITLPYSKGWTAKVDGVKAQILRADVGFMGLVVEGAGEHQIELSYETPGILVGLSVSAGTLVVITAYNVMRRVRERKAIESRVESLLTT